MIRDLVLIAGLALGAVATAAQACDMHGDFGYEMAAYDRGGPVPGPAAWEAEAARRQAQTLALSEARTAFSDRFAIKAEDPALVLADLKFPEKPSPDADRRSQSSPSDR